MRTIAFDGVFWLIHNRPPIPPTIAAMMSKPSTGHDPAPSAKSARPRSPVLLSALLLALALGLILHFAMTVAYVAPLSMAKIRALPVLQTYMEPYFAQGWELFAPDPILQSKYLMVSCRMEDSQGRVSETDPVDVTSRLHHEQRAFRLNHADRMLRSQLSPLTLIAPPVDPLADAIQRLENTAAKEVREVVEGVRSGKDENVKFGLRLLSRVASAECHGLHPQRRLTSSRAIMVSVSAPPFSRRNDHSVQGEKSLTDFGWMPYEHVSSL